MSRRRWRTSTSASLPAAFRSNPDLNNGEPFRMERLPQRVKKVAAATFLRKRNAVCGRRICKELSRRRRERPAPAAKPPDTIRVRGLASPPTPPGTFLTVWGSRSGWNGSLFCVPGKRRLALACGAMVSVHARGRENAALGKAIIPWREQPRSVWQPHSAPAGGIRWASCPHTCGKHG